MFQGHSIVFWFCPIQSLFKSSKQKNFLILCNWTLKYFQKANSLKYLRGRVYNTAHHFTGNSKLEKLHATQADTVLWTSLKLQVYMENLKMKKHELGAWLSLRGFPLGAKRSSTHLYTLQKKSL